MQGMSSPRYSCPAKRFRSSVLSTFPVAPRGMDSTRTTSSGTHHLATLPSKYCRRDALVKGGEKGREEGGGVFVVAVLVVEEDEEDEGGAGLGTTIRSGRSSHLGCGIAMTAAMAT